MLSEVVCVLFSLALCLDTTTALPGPSPLSNTDRKTAFVDKSLSMELNTFSKRTDPLTSHYFPPKRKCSGRKKMKPIVEEIPELGTFQLAEGPHWDVDTESLYFVDIVAKTVHKYVPATKKHTFIQFDKNPSIVIPVKGYTDRFVITQGREVVLVTWDGVSSTPSNVEVIAVFDLHTPLGAHNRINDGKADPLGNLWAGTMDIDADHTKGIPVTGTISSFSNGIVTPHEPGICVSNGFAWSNDLKSLFYIDSALRRVDQFDYDAKKLTISNRRTLFTFAKHGIRGYPDGQAIDAEGNLWVVSCQGQRVLKICSKKPETLLGYIEFPDDQLTSITFGGPNLDELYVTSAGLIMFGTDPSKLNKGAIYRVSGLNLKGLAFPRVKL